MVARSQTWTPTTLGALLLMLPCEFEGMLIHEMRSNSHRKIGRPEISSSRKNVAPKNRSRAMLQDRLAIHPRPWALGPGCKLQSCSQIQSADREIHWILVYYESHRTFCMDFVQERCYIGPPYENVTRKQSLADRQSEYPRLLGHSA